MPPLDQTSTTWPATGFPALFRTCPARLLVGLSRIVMVAGWASRSGVRQLQILGADRRGPDTRDASSIATGQVVEPPGRPPRLLRPAAGQRLGHLGDPDSAGAEDDRGETIAPATGLPSGPSTLTVLGCGLRKTKSNGGRSGSRATAIAEPGR